MTYKKGEIKMNALEFFSYLEEKADLNNVKDIRIVNDKTVPIGRIFRHGSLSDIWSD